MNKNNSISSSLLICRNILLAVAPRLGPPTNFTGNTYNNSDSQIYDFLGVLSKINIIRRYNFGIQLLYASYCSSTLFRSPYTTLLSALNVFITRFLLTLCFHEFNLFICHVFNFCLQCKPVPGFVNLFTIRTHRLSVNTVSAQQPI